MKYILFLRMKEKGDQITNRRPPETKGTSRSKREPNPPHTGGHGTGGSAGAPGGGGGDEPSLF